MVPPWGPPAKTVDVVISPADFITLADWEEPSQPSKVRPADPLLPIPDTPTTEASASLLRVPGGLTVSLVGAQRREVHTVASQLYARLSEGAPAAIRLDYDRGRRGTEIDWDSLDEETWRMRGSIEAGRIRYLSPLVRLRLLAAGRAPLHAAAVQQNDEAIVIGGMAGSGKTRVLMALLEAGWLFAAGEWIVVERGAFESADDRVDLRLHHLDALQRLRPVGQPQVWLRRRLARLPRFGRLDRFEFTSRALGVTRTSPTGVVPITRLVWSRRVGAVPRIAAGDLDDVLDDLVASEAERYGDLLARYRRESGTTISTRPIDDLPGLLRERFRQNLRGVPIVAVEHPGAGPLDDLARLVGDGS